jgi:hypothetical protein
MAVGELNTPSPIDRPTNQKINKEILELNHSMDQMDLDDVYRMFHLTSAQYTFFSATHGTFSKIDHILGNKARLSKYKITEKILSFLPDHNVLKLGLQNKNNSRKHAKNYNLNKTLLNN